MSLINYDIFCLRKSGILDKRAHVTENAHSFDISLNLTEYTIMHMSAYLRELFEKMVEFERNNTYGSDIFCSTTTHHFENNEFVKATIFHRVLMRKGSYFYVIQQSDRGVRFLLFAINRVHHSSVSLGFSMRIPVVSDEMANMKTELTNFTVEKMMRLQIINLPDLIHRDELYFL